MTTQAIQDLTGEYQIDPAHTRLGFVARHAMVTKVRGTFTDVEGRVHLDATDPSQSSATVIIKIASVDTGQEQRDAHLKGPDFFDSETFPEMTFTSTAISHKGGDAYEVTGDLTIRGTTRPVTFEMEYTGSAKDPFGNLRAGFEGRTRINRKDWGLTWNAALETGGLLVSENIDLELDVSTVKLTPTA